MEINTSNPNSEYRHWTRSDNNRLIDLWSDPRQTLVGIAKKMSRTEVAIYLHAKKIKLKLGVPSGFEGIWQAEIRTGYSHSVLLKIFKFGGVKIYKARTNPWTRGKTKLNRFVDPEAVNHALVKWEEYELVAQAARVRNIYPTTLRLWLNQEGYCRPKDTWWREKSEIIDAVVKKHQPLSLNKASKILKISAETLRRWLVEAGYTGAGNKRAWGVDLEAAKKIVEENRNRKKKNIQADNLSCQINENNLNI